MLFCPNCGKKVNKLYDGLCKDCLANKTELFVYTPKDVSICTSCGVVHDGNKPHKAQTQEKSIIEVIKNRIKVNKNLKDVSLNVQFEMPKLHVKHGLKYKTTAIMHLTSKMDSGIKIDETYELPFTIKYILCEKCSKKRSNYFEGILQIRHDDKKKIKEVLKELDIIMKEENKRSVFINDIINLKNGVDVYVTSQKHIKGIGKKLFHIFGGEIKINEQLFSRDNQRSKNIYRVNVLLRLPDFSLGDVIFVKNKLILIKRINGYLITGKMLKNEKIININLKDIEIEKIIPKEDIKTTTITLLKPNLEVLNPDNYQSEQLLNSNIIKNKKIEDKIKVINYHGLWAVPK